MIGYTPGWGEVAVAFVVMYAVVAVIAHVLWRKHGGN